MNFHWSIDHFTFSFFLIIQKGMLENHLGGKL